MNKSIVSIGFTNYVLDTPKAVQLLEFLSEAELYEEKWNRSGDGGTTSYHVFEQDDGKTVHTLKLLPSAFYRMAKLAGKPQR